MLGLRPSQLSTLELCSYFMHSHPSSSASIFVIIVIPVRHHHAQYQTVWFILIPSTTFSFIDAQCTIQAFRGRSRGRTAPTGPRATTGNVHPLPAWQRPLIGAHGHLARRCAPLQQVGVRRDQVLQNVIPRLTRQSAPRTRPTAVLRPPSSNPQSPSGRPSTALGVPLRATLGPPSGHPWTASGHLRAAVRRLFGG